MNYLVELHHGLNDHLLGEAESLDAILQSTHTMPVSLLSTANSGYIEESDKHVEGPRWVN